VLPDYPEVIRSKFLKKELLLQGHESFWFFQKLIVNHINHPFRGGKITMSDTNETIGGGDQKPEAAAGAGRAVPILAGLGLMLPAALACLSGYLWPTVRTLWLSLRDVGFGFSGSTFVGFENYARLLEDRALGAAIGFTLLLTVARLAAVAAVPLVLALGASALGRVGRRVVRVIFTIPIALYAPAAAAFGWRITLIETSRAAGFTLGDPATARAVVLLLDGLYTLALACGLGLIVLLPALRAAGPGHDGESGRRAWLPLLAVWLVGLLATVALTPQTFAFVSLLTGGGPARATTTIAIHQYEIALRMMRFGLGAALAALQLIPLLALGLLAGAILVFARLRLDLVPAQEASGEQERGEGRVVRVIVGVLALLVGLAACSLGVLPLAGTALGNIDPVGFAQFFEEIHPVPGLLLSIFVPLLGLLVLLPVTYLAALGIGALRPFGRWSEALLLLFTPWLFVTVSPLSLIFLNRLQMADRLNRPLTLNPPIAISVAGLVALTLFFKGRTATWRAGQEEDAPPFQGFFKVVIRPSLPLAAALGLGALLVGTQRQYWQTLVYFGRDVRIPANAWNEMGMALFAGPEFWAPAVLVYVVPLFLLFFVGLSVLQVFYLDRLVLWRDGPGEEETTFEDYLAGSALGSEPGAS
jgi:ABC-type sugar transport system permease subunit